MYTAFSDFVFLCLFLHLGTKSGRGVTLLVSTLWLVVYSEFLFSALGQNFFDLCTDTVNPYFAEGTEASTCGIVQKFRRTLSKVLSKVGGEPEKAQDENASLGIYTFSSLKTLNFD